MRSKPALILVSIAAIAVGACTSAASPAPTPPATQIAISTLAASAVPEASAATSPSTEPTASSGGGGAQATPGSTDPCSLITVDEASTAIGKKLSAGVSTKADQLRVCTFKSGQTEVKLFLAPPAPDAATAQGYWDTERAQIPGDVPIKDLSIFDRSAYGSGSAGGVSLSALFAIDGTQFFDFFCGFPLCSEAASVTAAQLIAGRLP